MALAFGLDIGGTGMKGAVVDTATGELRSERVRCDTPQPATVEAVLATAVRVIDAASWRGPVGCAFPGVVKRGVVGTAANIDESWLGVNVEERLAERLGGSVYALGPVDVPGQAPRLVHALNDADAAGVAEMRLGAGRGKPGVVMMLTLGTGIGSALFVDGRLVPNTELGHLELDGRVAESHASAAAMHRDGLGFAQWAPRVQRYIDHVERLFSPDLIIVGGGVVRNASDFLPLLTAKAPIVAAEMAHNAGIVGAALSVAP